jgi:hypothetical protein
MNWRARWASLRPQTRWKASKQILAWRGFSIILEALRERIATGLDARGIPCMLTDGQAVLLHFR